MIELTKYIQSNRIIKAYINNLDSIKKYNEYQHFISRLKLTDYNIEVSENIFINIIDDLKESLNSDIDTFMQKLLKEDDNGYLNEIYKLQNKEYFEYLYLTHIFDFYSILLRNHVEIDENVKSKIKFLVTDKNIDMLIRLSKETDLRTKEGTWCVNGIGYILFYADLSSSQKLKLQDAFADLFYYYTEKFDILDRNSVYGLTHCVIHISKFYTEDNYIYPKIEKAISTAKNIIYNTFVISKLKAMNSDMLAELLVTYKLLTKNNLNLEKLVNEQIAYNELVSRIDCCKNYICDHKENDKAFELKRNEHTNILCILYCRL